MKSGLRVTVTNLCLVNSSVLIKWMSLLGNQGLSGFVYLYFKKHLSYASSVDFDKTSRCWCALFENASLKGH